MSKRDYSQEIHIALPLLLQFLKFAITERDKDFIKGKRGNDASAMTCVIAYHAPSNCLDITVGRLIPSHEKCVLKKSLQEFYDVKINTFPKEIILRNELWLMERPFRQELIYIYRWLFKMVKDIRLKENLKDKKKLMSL